MRTSIAFALALATTAASSCSPRGQSAETAAPAPLPVRDRASCERLAGTQVSGRAIDSATHVEAGTVLIERGPLVLKAPKNFCRVAVTLSSGAGSSIKSEVWLPDAWNGKFFGAGGGGFSGGLDAAPLGLNDAVNQGYASAASDAGHPTVEGAAWAHDQPVKLVDWGNQANHVTAVFGKALVSAYYGEAPRRSYFEGCSNGGRDALMLAQRYPDDFDGIISGAPAANWTGLMSSFVANLNAYKVLGDAGQDKFKIVNDAIMAKCDALDGVKDGVLENPHRCSFDPSEVQCKAGQTSDCLSKKEADALRIIYQGHRLADGSEVFAGFALGTEKEPSGWRDSSKGGTGQMGVDYFRWMVYGDGKWDPEKFDINRDYAAAVERTGAIINADDPDLSAFAGKGGKLILWHGWNDTLIQADGTIKYYDAVKAKLGAKTDESIRFFMAPGVNHCFGGDGPSFFDKLGELDRWVESGAPPKRIVATKYDNGLSKLIGLPANPVRTRPLCAWPETAHYNGSGSIDDEANFTCKAD